MPEQQLNFSKIFPRLQEMSSPTVPQAVRRYVFSDTRALGRVSNDVVNRFRSERLVDAPVVVHARKVFGFIQRQYSRKVSNSFGDIGTSRSRLPLPWRTWITIRWLSMSATFKLHNSARRSPVAYSANRIV